MENNNIQPNLQNNQIKGKLSSLNANKIPSSSELNLNMNDVKNIAILKFGGVNKFGRALGVTSALASRLLSGSYIPLKPESIRKIANLLEIDPIVLTKIYDNIQYSKSAEKKDTSGAGSSSVENSPNNQKINGDNNELN